ncbi:Wzz/FepE/Etk N-terminal domain-containing protein [Pelagicoccus sp. SDUM812002]|uniref:Wzz/FepE/Etk N-terminal domain-containing protein n=1 Tax=Pelagicoccus sp. SDUM812002 TaxID=3041266 RepID=UPI00280C9294|nr:Wzz/FepE/Etk N-terminal domain-containing protein [Pelagicoccus sp. SDUM812002]MDQ8186272.1 Wzz/FepE/Etk N-terminal domain-containing protein [Pelagicoccus sp. SDUM812002]
MPDSNSPPPPYPQYPYPHEEDELSLIDLWNIVWKRKWPWLTFGPLFAIIGIFYALNQSEIFRAEATLVPNTGERGGGGLAALAGQFGGLASMAGINPGSGGSTETAIATLKSRKFLMPFLEDEEVLKAIFPKQWDEDTKTWIASNERTQEGNRPSKLRSYERFRQYMNISEDKKTGIVTLAMELQDPVLAAKWTNQLADRLNAHLREQAKLEAEKNLEYLNKQIAETRVLEIKESLYGLIESQTKNAMLANAKEDYAFKVIDPAMTPEERVKPKRTLIVIAAGLLGGFFGLFFCFVLHFAESVKRQEPKAV